MIYVISNKHLTGTVKADAISNAAIRQFQKDARHTPRCNHSDRMLTLEINGIEVAISITCWSLDTRSKTMHRCKDLAAKHRLTQVITHAIQLWNKSRFS